MTKNLVSIIVPVYNVEDYLKRCIDSLRNQTYSDLEIILVDDGSTDKSLEICETASREDKRVHVVHQKNSGSSIARNTGLDHASGEFVTFVDSDDHIEHETIEKMLLLIQEHNLDVVEFERDDPNGTKAFDNSFKIETQEEAILRTIKTSSFQVWKRLYRTSLVTDMRFIPNIIHQDVFYVIDLLNRIERIGHLDQALYKYNRENISVIRSKYSISKTQAGINATEYIINNTPETNKIVDCKKSYVVNYYTGHFYSLCRNSELDKEKKFRKKLKQAILKNATVENVGPRSLIVLLFPIKIAEMLAKMHMAITKNNYYN